MRKQKLKVILAALTGGVFALSITLVTGFYWANWQFWVIFATGVATKLPDFDF